MDSMNDTELLFNEHHGIPVLTLNRPAVHNAVNEALMSQWEKTMDMLEARDHVPALVLTGAGEKSFCAGGDLRYFDSLKGRDAGKAMSLRMQALLNRLYKASFPVIAAINGDAYGGGCEVITACHLRIAAGRSRFAFRQAINGVITGWGGGTRLLTQVSRIHAIQLLLTSDRVDAQTALQWGLVHQVVAEEDLMTTALGLARSIAGNSRFSVAAFLELSRTLDEQGEAAAVALETERFADSWVSEDFAKVLARFRK